MLFAVISFETWCNFFVMCVYHMCQLIRVKLNSSLVLYASNAEHRTNYTPDQVNNKGYLCFFTSVVKYIFKLKNNIAFTTTDMMFKESVQNWRNFHEYKEGIRIIRLKLLFVYFYLLFRANQY